MNIIEILKNRKKVLGQNSRNLEFIKKYGNPKGKKIADDKLLSKKILNTAGIPAPELIGVIKNHRGLSKFNWDNLPKNFVMKPVHGSQGSGIEIFYNKDENGRWIRSDRSKADKSSLVTLAQDIIDGKYSLHNEPDQVFFEERIKSHSLLKNYCYKGVPDIRVVVFNKIPIMAYVRFPTKESKGKANMILGAVGTGIDLATGVTTTSTYGKGNNGKGESIEYVAGTKLRYQGLKIPYWDKILSYALRAQEAVGLKFLAIDFLIDEKKGPMIVEINARPGLSIQIVNRAGLAWRLNKARGIQVKSISHGIRLGKDLFGGQVEEQIEKISGKEIISNVVALKINNDKFNIEALALVDTSRRTSIIEQNTAKQLKLIPPNLVLQPDEYIPTLVNLKIGANEIESEARIVPSKIKGYKVILGRNDLKDFIIDIKKNGKPIEQEKISQIIAKNPVNTIAEVEEVVKNISSKVLLLPSLRPLNLEEEKKKFYEKKCKYNPIFIYRPLRFNPDILLDRLETLKPPMDEIGELYRNKINELKKFIYLVNDIGSDCESFTKSSMAIYGDINSDILQHANTIIQIFRKRVKTKIKVVYLEINEVVKIIQSVLDKYQIHADIVITDTPGRTKMSVGKKTGRIFLNKNSIWTDHILYGTIAHEILTHLIRLQKGKEQKYNIFSIGTARYFKTEEGLATLMKYANRLHNPILYFPALNYFAINLALNNDFKTVYNILLDYTDPKTAWKLTYRVKRGIKNTAEYGAFCKDQYLAWTIEILKYILVNPQALDYAFNGKANIEELVKFTTPSPEIKFDNFNLEKLNELAMLNKI